MRWNIVGVMDSNYVALTFFQSTLVSWRPGLANFADIIKVVIILFQLNYNHGKNRKARN